MLSTPPAAGSPPLPPVFRAAIEMLLRADQYARELGVGNREFAVELQSLRATGLSNADLRWLVCKGYVEHAQECRGPENEDRQFRRHGELVFTECSSFLLTEVGARLATAPEPQSSQWPEKGPSRPIPKYYPDLKELWLLGELVKRFIVPAKNQELILTAFEEEGWPPRIDDPLPPKDEINPKKRIQDAICRLNRAQKPHQVKFRGAGDGTGVRWEITVRPPWK